VLIVTQVELEAGLRHVLIGGTLQLTATPRTSTGLPVPDRTVTWASASPGIATVNQSGVVRGEALGTAVIRATVDGITGQVTLEVRPVPVATIQVTLAASSVMAGDLTSAQAQLFDSAGGPLVGRVVTWSTSDAAIASVSPAGVVTTLGAGPVSIVATSEGKTGSAPLVVEPRTVVQLGFVTQPSTSVAGQPIAPAIRVAFQDATGATAAQATGTVTLSFSANPAGGTLSGTLTATAVAGVATFSDVRITKAGQLYSLQATAAGLTTATSALFDVSTARTATTSSTRSRISRA
jgi:hypothetical protein